MKGIESTSIEMTLDQIEALRRVVRAAKPTPEQARDPEWKQHVDDLVQLFGLLFHIDQTLAPPFSRAVTARIRRVTPEVETIRREIGCPHEQGSGRCANCDVG